MNDPIKLKCAPAVFVDSWDAVMDLLKMRIEQLKEQAIIEKDEKVRLEMKGKYLAFMELYSLRKELEGIKHNA